ncbi:MAG TPA: flagellar biosynthesis protein FliQ [Spirochaetota bacterium]|nr:flagellar biosynthesis protein FliQ [Spirochaetota bacterium]HOH37791.1 flagellar biosynthesis protein FliQ [Spirochaetota bacterium]HPJ14768.1 flagellar biosynthesis protein FliQ [Spirochaetota bacterium]HPM33888.1 flagellar biosynthesis protein FliQ [Spirochaetota bacterium]
MTDVLMIQMLREALMITLVVSAPLLGIGMIVGLIISIFQTTTSIQEQTLTFVPKIVAIFVAIIFFAGWMISMLTDYTRKIFMMISKLGGMM